MVLKKLDLYLLIVYNRQQFGSDIMTNNNALKNLSVKYPDFVKTYDKYIIEKLRTKYFNNIPLSIIMLSHAACVGYCFHRSIQFSQILPKFKLIRGDINVLSSEESPNHSWVEDDNYVYETTNNCKWDKDSYYNIYNPNIIEVITEETCMQDNDYIYVLNNYNNNNNINLDNIELILECLELMEMERPTINQDLLLNEINIFRHAKNLKTMYYKKYVKQMSEKLFSEYYDSIK